MASTLAYCRYLPPKAVECIGVGAAALRLAPLEPLPLSPALTAIQTSAP